MPYPEAEDPLQEKWRNGQIGAARDDGGSVQEIRPRTGAELCGVAAGCVFTTPRCTQALDDAMMDKLIDNMGDMGLVDTVPLQYNTKAVNFISVTMFVNCVVKCCAYCAHQSFL
jgi:hypothetical protein